MLPTYPQLADEDVVRICRAIHGIGREALGRRRAAAMPMVAAEIPGQGRRSAAHRRAAA